MLSFAMHAARLCCLYLLAAAVAAGVLLGTGALGSNSLAAQGRQADPCVGSRDVRLTNGRIVTMDAAGTVAAAR